MQYGTVPYGDPQRVSGRATRIFLTQHSFFTKPADILFVRGDPPRNLQLHAYIPWNFCGKSHISHCTKHITQDTMEKTHCTFIAHFPEHMTHYREHNTLHKTHYADHIAHLSNHCTFIKSARIDMCTAHLLLGPKDPSSLSSHPLLRVNPDRFFSPGPRCLP